MSDELEGTQEEEFEEEEEQETESSEEDTSEVEQSEEQEEEEEDSSPDIFNMSDDEYLEFINKSRQQPEKKEARKPEQSEKQESKEEQPAEKIDYEAFYKSVMAPFKSNGKTVTPRNFDDIRRLMQMGTDYTRKTQALAPMRKIAETVRNAKINDADLNNLINAYNGDKEAIKLLLKKHSINPMDIDVDSEDNSYTPKNNIASEQQVAFSEVMDEIQPSLGTINQILEKKWDAKSRTLLIQHPELLRGLHQEIEMNRFDAVQQVLESEKALGRYTGMSDLEAYMQIVTAYTQYEAEMAKHKAKQSANKPQKPSAEKVNKAKAAPNKQSPSGAKKRRITDDELLSMSDEDFRELAAII